MTIEERIQEELKYSDTLNNKIKKIENKTKQKKNFSNSQNKLYFNFKTEYNYLKDQQSKLETEILFALEEFEYIESDRSKAEEITEEFYSMMMEEKKIRNEISLNIININEIFKVKADDSHKDKNKLIEVIYKNLKTFNDSLIKIENDEKLFLLEQTQSYYNRESQKEFNCEDEYKNKENNEFWKLGKSILSFDYFNSLKLYDIDYLIHHEIKTNKMLRDNIADNQIGGGIYNKNEEVPTYHNNYDLIETNVLQKYFGLNKFNISSKLTQIVNRSLIILGEEETKQIVLNLNRANDLSYLKYEIEYKSLFSNFIKKLQSKENDSNTLNDPELSIKMRINNLNFLCRSSIISRDKFIQRLQDEFPKIKRDKIITINHIFDAIYDFRISKEILFNNYQKEFKEFLKNSLALVEESIVSQILEINENIKRQEFAQMKEEMDILNAKNKEIFQIKQNIKEETLENEKQKLRLELEKKEKQSIEYYNKIKGVSQKFRAEKNTKELREKEDLSREFSHKQKQLKDEIKLKLPLIVKRQNSAVTQFVKAYKQKEIIKEEKQKRESEINKIVENLKVRPKVEIDPERVKRVTEALKIRMETKFDKADKVVLFRNHGFTVDNLMSDLRYKISSALCEAGLLNKEYSNQILMKFNNVNL